MSTLSYIVFFLFRFTVRYTGLLCEDSNLYTVTNFQLFQLYKLK